MGALQSSLKTLKHFQRVCYLPLQLTDKNINVLVECIHFMNECYVCLFPRTKVDLFKATLSWNLLRVLQNIGLPLYIYIYLCKNRNVLSDGKGVATLLFSSSFFKKSKFSRVAFWLHWLWLAFCCFQLEMICLYKKLTETLQKQLLCECFRRLGLFEFVFLIPK